MINGSMAALPAALTGQLGMTLQGHQSINHQLSQLRHGLIFTTDFLHSF